MTGEAGNTPTQAEITDWVAGKNLFIAMKDGHDNVKGFEITSPVGAQYTLKLGENRELEIHPEPDTPVPEIRAVTSKELHKENPDKAAIMMTVDMRGQEPGYELRVGKDAENSMGFGGLQPGVRQDGVPMGTDVQVQNALTWDPSTAAPKSSM